MGDNISRRAALDAVSYETLECYQARKDIRALPSTDHNGHWTLTPMLPDNHRYECSNCKRHHRERYDFCPSCGADMRGEGDGR